MPLVRNSVHGGGKKGIADEREIRTRRYAAWKDVVIQK
jgi:hypothetical protein